MCNSYMVNTNLCKDRNFVQEQIDARYGVGNTHLTPDDIEVRPFYVSETNCFRSYLFNFQITTSVHGRNGNRKSVLNILLFDNPLFHILFSAWYFSNFDNF